MLDSLLAYQLARQADGPAKARAPELGALLAELVDEQALRLVPAEARQGAQVSSNKASRAPTWRQWLADFLRVAEFLARETRLGGHAS